VVAPAAAQEFGKYTLVAKLATGGMAEIFLARLVGAGGFDKLVCIKRILPHLAKDQTLTSMFLAEASIAAQISHPNVCQVFELGEIDGRYFIAMEYLEGVPLACFRRPDIYGGAIDPRLVVGLGMQACEGLHHAHGLKKNDGTPLEVVHRDVSSNNLFATKDGVVKVLDFGIAKIQDASVKTSTGSMKGTYAYMAPEQLRGERLDRRTDVFAMGIVLWELFGRQHLFKRETDFLTFQAITTEPIPDICELRPDVPPALGAAIAKALSRNRDDRFPSTRALGQALAEAVVPLGGPLGAAAISDEIERAFESRLRDQRKLIRTAREGGVFSLDDDLGPQISHGTEMMTTPVKFVSADHAPSSPSAPAPPVVQRPTASMPTAPDRAPGRWLSIALVLILLGGGALAVVLYASREQPSTEAAPAVRMATISVDAAEPMIVVDAAIAEVKQASPPDAGVVVRTQKTPRVKEVAASGPPGFITIDATPVYAVIYIDGKNRGETPLVKLSLSPGKHAVKAVSPSGSVKTFSIVIESGKVAQTRRIEW
jgi:eukaryotic-like serine/threonine-protein kinase